MKNNKTNQTHIKKKNELLPENNIAMIIKENVLPLYKNILGIQQLDKNLQLKKLKALPEFDEQLRKMLTSIDKITPYNELFNDVIAEAKTSILNNIITFLNRKKIEDDNGKKIEDDNGEKIDWEKKEDKNINSYIFEILQNKLLLISNEKSIVKSEKTLLYDIISRYIKKNSKKPEKPDSEEPEKQELKEKKFLFYKIKPDFYSKKENASQRYTTFDIITVEYKNISKEKKANNSENKTFYFANKIIIDLINEIFDKDIKEKYITISDLTNIISKICKIGDPRFSEIKITISDDKEGDYTYLPPTNKKPKGEDKTEEDKTEEDITEDDITEEDIIEEENEFLSNARKIIAKLKKENSDFALDSKMFYYNYVCGISVIDIIEKLLVNTRFSEYVNSAISRRIVNYKDELKKEIVLSKDTHIIINKKDVRLFKELIILMKNLFISEDEKEIWKKLKGTYLSIIELEDARKLYFEKKIIKDNLELKVEENIQIQNFEEKIKKIISEFNSEKNKNYSINDVINIFIL